jgi:hypothetical protein
MRRRLCYAILSVLTMLPATGCMLDDILFGVGDLARGAPEGLPCIAPPADRDGNVPAICLTPEGLKTWGK